MRLLVTDDQHSVHLFIDKMLDLEAAGISAVEHAANGEEALKKVEQFAPDILLLDIRMPVMDGLETLRRLTERGYQGEVIILSAYGEFEYARQCIGYGVKEYLLKPINIEELQQKLRQSAAAIRQRRKKQLEELVGALMEGRQEAGGEKELRSLLSDAAGYCCVCTRQGDSLEEDGTLCSASRKELCQTVLRWQSREQWERFVARSQAQGAFSMGVSLFTVRPEQLAGALGEAKEALRQGFYNQGVNVYRRSPFSSRGEPDDELVQTLSRDIERGDVGGIRADLDNLFSFFEQQQTDPDYVCGFCDSYLMRLNKNFVETFQRLQGSRLTYDFQYQDAVSLKNTFFRFILHIRCDMQPEQALSDADILQRIKRYIDEHYERDLSLDTVARHFFISKFQISRLFKRMYGVNYSEYILEVRMREAAALLQKTPEKVESIAHRVGFENAGYFSKAFKKYFAGRTPAEYRSLSGKQGDSCEK